MKKITELRGTGVAGIEQPTSGVFSLRLTDGSLTDPVEIPAGAVDPELVKDVLTDPVVLRDTQVVTQPLGDRIYAPAGMPESVLAQQARTSKGGGIGIGDRGAIAIRFDDWHAAFKANAYSIMTRLGLPAGYATISRLDQQPWTAGVTAADMGEWNRNGVELHSHGTDHKDPSPYGDAGLVEQIVASKAEIESWGVKCQGWMQPGATPVGPDIPYGATFTTTSDLYTTRAGALVRSTYPVSEHDCHGIIRNLPSGYLHGNAHITPSDGLTLRSTLDMVNTAIRDKVGLEMMFHCGNIGKPGNITWAEFEQLMTHLADARRDGKIEVVTPSGLVFTDKTASRLNLIEDQPFDQMVTGEALPWGWSGSWAGKSVVHDAGPEGQKALRFDDTTTTLVTRRINSLKTWGLAGETFVFRGLVRSTTETAAVSRTMISDYADSSVLSLNLSRPISGTQWTQVFHAFTIPPGTDRLSVSLGRWSGGGLEWADVQILKV